MFSGAAAAPVPDLSGLLGTGTGPGRGGLSGLTPPDHGFPPPAGPDAATDADATSPPTPDPDAAAPADPAPSSPSPSTAGAGPLGDLLSRTGGGGGDLERAKSAERNAKQVLDSAGSSSRAFENSLKKFRDGDHKNALRSAESSKAQFDQVEQWHVRRNESALKLLKLGARYKIVHDLLDLARFFIGIGYKNFRANNGLSGGGVEPIAPYSINVPAENEYPMSAKINADAAAKSAEASAEQLKKMEADNFYASEEKRAAEEYAKAKSELDAAQQNASKPA